MFTVVSATNNSFSFLSDLHTFMSFLALFYYLEFPVLFWTEVSIALLPFQPSPVTDDDCHVGICQIKEGPFRSSFAVRVFRFIVLIMNSCWILMKCFYCIYWDDHDFLFYSVNLENLINWFPNVKANCIPGINKLVCGLSFVSNALFGLLISSFREFCICVYERSWQFLFLIKFLSGFGVMVVLAL